MKSIFALLLLSGSVSAIFAGVYLLGVHSGGGIQSEHIGDALNAGIACFALLALVWSLLPWPSFDSDGEWR